MVFLKRLLASTLAFLALLYFLAAISFSVMSQIIFKQDPVKILKNAGTESKIVSFDYNQFHIEGVALGNDSLPLVLLVHGSPGRWTDFEHLVTNKELISKVKILAVDRLGYGQSSPESYSLEIHTEVLAALLKSNYPGEKAICVGHSYGGPVIAKLAMDHPEVVSSLVFVAGSIDPAMEKKEWFNEMATWKIIQWILPDAFITSNKEIMTLKGELEMMLPLWKDIRVPVIMIQGTTDKLVPAENIDFAKRVLVNANPLEIKMVEKQGHLIPWQKPELIIEAIMQLLDLPN